MSAASWVAVTVTPSPSVSQRTALSCLTGGSHQLHRRILPTDDSCVPTADGYAATAASCWS